MAADPTLQIIVKMKDLFSKQIDAVHTTVTKTTGRMRTAFTKLGTSVSSLKGQLGLLIGAWVSWRGVTAAWSAVKTYGKLEAVRTAFGLLRKDVGIAANAMDDWRTIVRGTVSDADFLTQANKAIFSGMIKGKKDIDALAYAAFNYARLMGREVTPALEQMVQAVAAASPEALRPLGVDAEALFRIAQRAKGGPLGITEKQRIMLDALIEKSLTGFGEISNLQTTISEQVQQSVVHWGNVQENIGEAFHKAAKLNVQVSSIVEQLSKEFPKVASKGLKTFTDVLIDATVALLKFNIEQKKAFEKAGQWPHFTAGDYTTPRGVGQGTGIDTARQYKALMDQAVAPIRETTKIVREEEEVIVSAQQSLCDKLWMYSIKTAEAIGDGVDFIITKTNDALSAIWGEGGQRNKETGELVGMGRGIYGGMEAYGEEVKDIALNIAEGVQDIFRAMEDSISEFFFDAMMGKLKTFKDYLRSFLTSVAKILSQVFAKAAMAGIGGALGLPGFQATQSAKGGVFKHGYQSGGIVTGPELTWIGEGKNAEAVVPLPDNRSIPVTLKGGTQAPPVNVNFNISAMDGASVRRVLYSERSMIKDIIRGALGTDPDFRGAVRST